MAYLALQTEQEAQKQEISALIHSFTNPYATYRKEYMSFDTITRAYQANNRKITKKTKHLGDKAKKLLAPIIQKLLKGKTVLLNSKYISKVTERKTRQNKNILNELRGILNIKYHKSIKCYSFEFIPTIVYELSDVRKKKVSCNKLHYSSSNSIYIKNNNIEYIDLESNFLQNTESVKLEENVESQIREFLPPHHSKLKKRPSNKRKKPTNAERKARVYHFNQYEEPQDLKYHYPLTKEDANRLQSLSGRDFSLNAMNEILLDMSKRLDNSFCSKAQFMVYFGKCLRFEMRDSVKTGNDNFRIKANIPREKANILKEKAQMTCIANTTEVRAYDLKNRTTDGFQPLTNTIKALSFLNLQITKEQN